MISTYFDKYFHETLQSGNCTAEFNYYTLSLTGIVVSRCRPRFATDFEMY